VRLFHHGCNDARIRRATLSSDISRKRVVLIAILQALALLCNIQRSKRGWSSGNYSSAVTFCPLGWLWCLSKCLMFLTTGKDLVSQPFPSEEWYSSVVRLCSASIQSWLRLQVLEQDSVNHPVEVLTISLTLSNEIYKYDTKPFRTGKWKTVFYWSYLLPSYRDKLVFSCIVVPRQDNWVLAYDRLEEDKGKSNPQRANLSEKMQAKEVKARLPFFIVYCSRYRYYIFCAH
jgi:hypothetical protein